MNKMVELAKKCIGMNEKDGSFREIIDVYNNHSPLAMGYKMKYTDPWCATFISYLSIRCGYTSIVPTECGCERQINLFKRLGTWIEDDSYVPKEGDIIYYDWQDSGKGDDTGWSDHVGIVEFCDGQTITVIEGNKNDAVSRRCIAVNARYIRGYASPNYPKPDVKNITEYVKRLYKVVLDRDADEKGLQEWVTVLTEGKAGAAEVVYGFFFSAEFVLKHVSNDEYVTKLYKALLGRNPDRNGKDAWVEVLKTKSRVHVFNGFVQSDEFKAMCKSYGVNV